MTAGFRLGTAVAGALILDMSIAWAQPSTTEGDSFRSEIFVGSQPEN
ncbi:MAG TPA: hypothetical protein VES88_05595 [Gemmatimonadaceae bacterium]|nr:hypothetical protein [Gemmatimonadaceae bacterium]